MDLTLLLLCVGGSIALQLGAGRDCTALFESYHALASNKPWNTLAKYEVNRPLIVAKLAQFKWLLSFTHSIWPSE
jgi:hypothetical protein